MKARLRNEAGFTLVELMVTVLVIGILTSIAIPVYAGVSSKAEVAACQANLRTIDGAINAYWTEYGVFPTTIGELIPDTLKKEPHCPENSGTYSIVGSSAVCSNGHTY